MPPWLAKRNLEVSTAASGEEAIRMFRVFDPAIVLLDVAMAGMSGLDTLERIKQIKPDVSVIMISGQNDPELIFRASKAGADDYIAKPFEPKELDIRLAKVIEKQRLLREVSQLREQVRRQSEFGTLFGTSPKMEEVKMTIEQVADTTATVLIRGESGTGKEVVARMIYAQSSRREKPFVKVNCAAIPHELLESELFGYEPGAFTGANRQKLGKFDQANYGSISSMRSARCIRRCRPNCCMSCKMASSLAWAASATSRWTCGCSPLPISPWKRPSPKDNSARIFSTASMWSLSIFRPCASGARRFPSSSISSCASTASTMANSRRHSVNMR
jgi:DNA-binding NarL/FixJ family response regulator